MPIITDSWSRTVATELEVLQQYLTNLSNQLGPKLRIPLNVTGRNEFQIFANDSITGLYTPWFSKNKDSGAMLAIKLNGGSPMHISAPAFSSVTLGPTGMLIYDQFIREPGNLRCWSCETGEAVKPLAAMKEFLVKCLNPERSPIITGLQLPLKEDYGLLTIVESSDEDGRPLQEEQLLLFKDCGSSWELIRSKAVPKPDFYGQTYYLCAKRLIRFPQNGEPENWIEYLDRNSFIKRGTINRKYSCQLSSEYSGDIPREVVTGVDSEHVYILDRATGVLQRIPVK
jgi:hypothetical protein